MAEGETRRIAFTVHYDGEAFFGWQLQRPEVSVQGVLEDVLRRLFDSATRIAGSGRTDRGVHATGQVVAVNAPARWTPEELRRAMNALLPGSIWVAEAAEVERRFHPRFDAVARSYVYRLGTDADSASPFHSRWCWALGRSVDLDRMKAPTEAVVGDHSFRAFAKAGQEERGDRCMVEVARWAEWDLGVELHVTANRFLHHMVRYLVGTLVEIGLGRREMRDMALLLGGAEGLETSPPAPPQGLFLTRVDYPEGAYPVGRRAPRAPSRAPTAPT